MHDSVELSFHVKRHSNLDLRRVAQAQAQGFSEPITAYLSNAFFLGNTAAGVVFDHNQRGQDIRFEDGRLLSVRDLVDVHREGRFWVLTTGESRYVIATFKRDDGRRSLRDFLSQSRAPCS
ncbi:hypothetical protein ACSQ5K_14735 [Pseudomonas sp. PhalM4]